MANNATDKNATDTATATVAEQLAAIETTVNALRAVGFSDAELDAHRSTLTKKLVEPIQEKVADFMKAAAYGALSNEAIKPGIPALLGSRLTLTVLFDTDTGETIVETSFSGTRSGTQKKSKSSGGVLIVNEEAFNTWADLTRKLGVFEDKKSQAAVYRALHAKDATKYPTPTAVAYEDFYEDPDSYAPGGFYGYDREKGQTVKMKPNG